MIKQFHLGLIGFPVEHSLSPALHEMMFKMTGQTGQYQLYAVHPTRYAQDLQVLADHIRAGRIQGLNITIPHKRVIMAFLDEMTDQARAIGAVNMIFKKDDLLFGDNSDADGFYNDIIRNGFDKTRSGERRALILGAGGAARAAAFSLLRHGWQVHVTARRMIQTEDLAQDMEEIGTVVCLPDITETYMHHFDLIVNATPVGMVPQPGASPWPNRLPLPARANVYDMIYNPTETLWMKTARSAGLQVSNGMGMLVEQAAISFETWTGAQVSRDTLFKEILKHNIFERRG